MRNDLTAEHLRQLVHYEPLTGRFTSLRTGKTFGSHDARGKIRLRINKVNYLAHRLAWLYVHGEWPVDLIDHVNGNPSDNRLENLRQATLSQNNRNRKRWNARSGFRGVYETATGGSWIAQIRDTRGKLITLGCFSCPHDASEFRQLAEAMIDPVFYGH